MSFGKATISGNLTKDATLTKTKNGTSALNMSIAFSNYSTDDVGNRVEHSNFIEASLYGPRAEKIATYLKRGTKVAVEGNLRYQDWEKDGVKHSRLALIVEDIDFKTKATKAA